MEFFLPITAASQTFVDFMTTLPLKKHFVSFSRGNTEKNVTKDGDNFEDCSETVDCTSLDSEVVQPDFASEEEDNDQVRVAQSACCIHECCFL